MSTIQDFYEPNLSPLTQAVLWQYNNAFAVNSLIDSKLFWYVDNDESFWINWINNVFNLITANDFGLVVWSIILDVPLFLNNAQPEDETDIFGFNSYVPSFVPPNLENTYSNFGTSDSLGANFSGSGSSTALTTEQQRFILRLKYLKLVSRGSIPQTNSNFDWLMHNPTMGSVALGLFSPTLPIANPTIVTGNTLTGSMIISVSSVAGLLVGQGVIGTGVPRNAAITAIDVPNSTITISLPAISTNLGIALDIGLPSVWVLEDFGMQITYQFNFFLPVVLQQAIAITKVLPDPAGVGVTAEYWDGSAYIPFITP